MTGPVDAALCSGLEAHFDKGHRNAYFPPENERDVCLDPGGIRIAPRRGMAVMFASSKTQDASEPLPATWHKGCHVTSGVKRPLPRSETPAAVEARHTCEQRNGGETAR